MDLIKIVRLSLALSTTALVFACGGGSSNSNKPPVANMAISQPIVEQLTTFSFSSEGSSDPDGTISGYTWDFGDGSKSTEKSPVHTFNASGIYTVKLTVTDNNNQATSKTEQVNIVQPAISVASTVAAISAVLPNVATVDFPESSFPRPTRIGIWNTQKPETAADFSLTAEMFSKPLRAQNEIRINTGLVQPTKTAIVKANVPTELQTRLQAKDELKVFVQIFEDGGNGVLDSFELIDSVYDDATKTLQFELLPEMFTDSRTADSSWEAVIIVGSTSTKPVGTSLSNSQTKSAELPAEVEQPRPWPSIAIPGASPVNEGPQFPSTTKATGSECNGATLRPPLANLVVTGEFNPPKHYGTDYRADTGTEVFSMANGTVSKVGFDERPLKKPDPRSGKMVKGWGYYIIVEHEDGSKTLYAHLKKDEIKVTEKQPVSEGTPIALSNDSGGSQAPHLHVEYAPNGEIFKRPSKVNPNPCIGTNVTGNVQVRDNGSAADDAFSISVNGRGLCVTAIGASNSCALNALRSGNSSLTITATIAPDNLGTYEISLSGGLAFQDGSTRVSGTLDAGGSATFIVVIP